MISAAGKAVAVRYAAAAVIAGTAAVAAAACGAGPGAQTSEQQSHVAGVNVEAGDLLLRDLRVESGAPEGYAPGDDAVLQVWIGNEGTEAVALVGVESPDGTITFATAEPEADPTADVAADGPAATSTPGGPEAIEGERSFAAIPIPIDGYVRLDQGPQQTGFFLLENVEERLLAGEEVEVAFHFSDGTAVTVDVPVVPPKEPVDREYYESEEP
ncbi:hypothetical protein [Glycomyces albidus]|uniref:Copper chaperone PCu(A)C n=1 Tax=Glycomyces albidus TaxID=2656774 RepID=A0A6L5GB18_9ACTN|nr:hypothetical protein [Glycomyces albidus]MQM26877.1 hypothetical protein [Glycomyces albidus]